MTVISRDDIIEFFDFDRNFPIASLLKKYGFESGRNRDKAEAMLNELRVQIYLRILKMDLYEVDVSERV